MSLGEGWVPCSFKLVFEHQKDYYIGKLLLL